MRNDFQLLYNDMLRDIERCMQMDLPELKKIESCFWVASNYWEKLKEFVRKRDFGNECEEIDFFRNVKPKFTSQVEYFIRLSEALLCEPGDKEGAVEYWNQEAERLERFIRKNETFIHYYESGESFGDNMYFLRCNNHHGPTQTAPPYDVEMEFCSSHDQVLRSYLALQTYNYFANKRIEKLQAAIATGISTDNSN